MPHILRDVNPIVATLLTQHHIFYDRAIIIVSSHSNLASQDNERLFLRRVPMDGDLSPWLHSIQKTVALILQRLMKVIVHAQTGRRLRLFGQVIQYCLRYLHTQYALNSTAQDTVLAIRNSRVSDFRHSHIISAAGLSRPELISVLLLARKQWPSAKILGISELGLEIRDQRIISSGRHCPSDAMNQIRRALSDLP